MIEPVGLFRFCLGNHTRLGITSCEDILLPLMCQLADLGLAVQRNDEDLAVGPQAINVYLEGFDEASRPFIEAVKGQGGRFMCVATERYTPNGFNTCAPAMVKRHKYFMEVAPLFDSIWCLVPETAIELVKLGLPAVHVELGYSPRLLRNQCATEPVADFGFFGSLVPRRLAIIDRFRKAGFKVEAVGDFRPMFERDAVMRSAKVVLGIKPVGNWQIVSNSRCGTALNIGRPIIMEPHTTQSPWMDIAHVSRSHGSFIEEAVALLQRWREEWHRQYEAYKRLLAPEFCVGRALMHTGMA